MKIMLVEDEYLLNKTITTYLVSKGFSVDSYSDGNTALEALRQNHLLYILDIDLPEIDGVTLLESIRDLYPEKPVIMISATIDINTISKAYNNGCNDYLKKPFDIKELELKIRAFMRMYEKRILLADGLEYDPVHHRLFFNDDELILTQKELSCLDLLISNRGHIVSHDQVELAVWGSDADTAHLRQLVNRLRKKLPVDIIQNRIGERYLIT